MNSASVAGSNVDRQAVHGAQHIAPIDTTELDRRLAEGGDLLAWVTTSWCVPCQALAPHLDAFSARHADRIDVVALDGDANVELRTRFQIAGFPTLILFHDGIRVWQRAGAFERSADEVSGRVMPLLDAVSGSLPDLCPARDDSREERELAIPAARAGVQFEQRTPDGRHALDPGVHSLPAGAELVVTLQADHRREEPVAWSSLGDLAPGSVDGLEVFGVEVDLDQLGRMPALSRLRQVTAPTGRIHLGSTTLSELPRLRSLSASLTPESAEPLSIFLNDEWVHPAVRDEPGVRAPGPRRTPLVHAPASEIVDDSFRGATERGLSLVGFLLAQAPGLDALTALLDSAAAAHPDLHVYAAEVDRCPQAATDLGVHGVPAVILLADGAPIWRTGAVDDPEQFSATLDAALQAVATHAQGAPRGGDASGMRPARTLRLPEGPLGFYLTLQPPALGMTAALTLTEGGQLEVPAGWSVIADIGADTGDDAGVDLQPLGRDDLDVLFACVDTQALAVGSSFAVALARLSGLRVLDLEVPEGLDARMLEPLVRGFDDLQALNAFTYPSDGGPPTAPANLLEVLRPALPRTVINGRWNSLDLPED